MSDDFSVARAVVAGVVGTAAMSLLMQMAPAMGLPPMNIPEMLASVMGGLIALGWVAHFIIGTLFAVTFAAAAAGRLPGPATVQGMLFALAPWLAAQVMVMPLMGAGFFSGSALAALGSLMGHLVFGAVVGGVYGHGHSPAHFGRAAHV